MAVKQIKIDVSEVTIGMFVSGLDRPWTQTPFPLQGFYVRDQEEIRNLKSYCRHVYIDVAKGASPLKTTLQSIRPSARGRTKQARTAHSAIPVATTPIRVRSNVYPETVVPLEKEISRARALHREVYDAVTNVMTQIDQDHHKFPVAETKRAASAMVDSVLRSPDAFTWLSRVREKDQYTYSHAVRSAVWGILFGRHIGLPKGDLDVLAMGLLLKDIGKTRIPKHILEKRNRTPTEQEAYERFVDYGVEILQKLPDVQPRVTSVIQTHCERINGSGFPDHLRGDRIPMLGRIAGIVTFYDKTTNPRGEFHPLPPSKAVAKLYELRNVEFQEDLVVEFIRAIGLYPTGTLVELNSGEVAVVVEQNFSRRLKPRIMIVTDTYKQLLPSPQFFDLAEDARVKQEKIDAGKLDPADVDQYEIVQDLEPGTYDINIAAIRDQYMEQRIGNRLLGFLKGKSKLNSLFGKE